MENIRIVSFEKTAFVRFIKDISANKKKNVGNGYLPLHYNEVYYICSNLRKNSLKECII